MARAYRKSVKRTVIMRHEIMEKKLETNQATRISADVGIDPATNPAVEALTKMEQDVWRLRVCGHTLKEIGDIVELKEFQVCRVVKGIEDKFKYLLQFRQVLFAHEQMLAKFLAKSSVLCPEKENSR